MGLVPLAASCLTCFAVVAALKLVVWGTIVCLEVMHAACAGVAAVVACLAMLNGSCQGSLGAVWQATQCCELDAMSELLRTSAWLLVVQCAYFCVTPACWLALLLLCWAHAIENCA